MGKSTARCGRGHSRGVPVESLDKGLRDGTRGVGGGDSGGALLRTGRTSVESGI